MKKANEEREKNGADLQGREGTNVKVQQHKRKALAGFRFERLIKKTPEELF